MSVTSDSIGAAAWERILRVHARTVGTIAAEVEEATGLPLSWYDVLLELVRAGGTLRIGDLGERVVLSRTRVSRIVDNLVTAGHVARTSDTTDGRARIVTITDTGRRAFRRTAPVYLASIEAHFSQYLTDRELAELDRLLARILADHP